MASEDKKKPESPQPCGAHGESTDSVCKRCGTCCMKGGPSFHLSDKALIDNGTIPSKCLYTIRKGEMAYDNVRQCLEPVSSDVIKIKGKGKTWTCLFLDEAQSDCTIYENRPVECRALKCWDTDEIETLYARRRLKREDLLATIEGLWDLIIDHQERCNYDTIYALTKAIEGEGAQGARQKLAELIKFDDEIRKLVVSRGGLDKEMLDFLFGRPLSQTLKNVGLKVLRKDGKLVLRYR